MSISASEGRQIWTDTVLALRPPGICAPDDESLRRKEKGRHGGPFEGKRGGYLKGAAIALPNSVAAPEPADAWKT